MATAMKLYSEVETDVPDEVGEALLAEQARNEANSVTATFSHSVYVGNWTYRIEAPIVWVQR